MRTTLKNSGLIIGVTGKESIVRLVSTPDGFEVLVEKADKDANVTFKTQSLKKANQFYKQMIGVV